MTTEQSKNLKTHCRITFDGIKWYWATVKNVFFRNDPKPLCKPNRVLLPDRSVPVKQLYKKYGHYQCRNYQRRQVACIINSVGMNRKMEFYADGYNRIGYYIARIIDYSYNIDKGGLSVSGCGMDMIFHVLSSLNYAMVQIDTGKTLTELLKTKECGEHIYDKYFFNANQYVRL